MKRLLPLLIGTVGAFIALTSSHADDIFSDWVPAGDGIWEDDANWTSVPWPNNIASPHRYSANIGDSASHRVITTTGDIILSSLQLNQTSSSGSLIFKLGGNMELKGDAGGFPKITFNNTTEDASKLVIDLNGHHLNMTSSVSSSSVRDNSHYTVRGEGGAISQRQIYQPKNVVYEGSITIRAIQAATQHLGTTTTYAETTTLQMAASGTYDLNFGSNPIGSLTIGEASNTAATNIRLSVKARLKGSVAILSYEGAENGAASSIVFRDNGKLYVAGGFRDEATDDSKYTSENLEKRGTIIFNGSPESEQEVSIGRTGLDTHFQVGEDAESLGNIVLKQDLSTTGSFTLTSASRLNLSNHSLKGGNIQIHASAIVGIVLGEQVGAIRASGDLALDTFSLEVAHQGGAWVNGSKLVLFQYDGELTGVPTVNITDAPVGFSYDALVNDTENKEIYLTNVVIPEPRSTALLLLIGAVTAFKLGALRKSL